MKYNLTQKIIKEHLVEGSMTAGQEIGIRIDQTLTQDSTGTMAYLQLEALNVPRVKTKLSVAYVDHNMLQEGSENADDHRYIQTVAAKHGIYFSRPGNGICHQVHLERFGATGETLLGSDSHTPTAGGLGMFAIGAGGLDVALAMAGKPYYLIMPRIVAVRLSGRLNRGVSAKDIILEVLSRLSVKGGVGKVIEYCGEGVKTLSVPERATITNMGAELGATSSIFPSDEITREFLKSQNRQSAFKPLSADEGCGYDENIEIDLSALEPLAAAPHSPDNIVKVAGTKIRVDQVAIGSCTNGSLSDLRKVAAILRGKTAHKDVSLVISPGSRQTLKALADGGELATLIAAGARILESGCGPCIGMGQAPKTNAVSLRTFNRNFEGRSGTPSAKVYLVSPETAAASALTGYLTDPREYCQQTAESGQNDGNGCLRECEKDKRSAIVISEKFCNVSKNADDGKDTGSDSHIKADKKRNSARAVTTDSFAVQADEISAVSSGATSQTINLDTSDNMIIPPESAEKAAQTVVERGPNIKPFPKGKVLEKTLSAKILIKLGDNITTDHIMPSNAKLLPYRSNIPYLSDFCLAPCDSAFPARAKAEGGGIILAGENYGQGSSREHAALVPLYLGIRAVIAKSFARIHRDNLINNGILSLVISDKEDYNKMSAGDSVIIENIREKIGQDTITAKCGGNTVNLKINASGKEIKTLLAGGKLNEQN